MEVFFDYNSSKNKVVFTTDDIDIFNQIREHFSVQNPAARFAKRYNHFIQARKYIISPTGACDIGIYYIIRKYLIENQITCNVNVTEKLRVGLEPHSDDQTIFLDFKFDLRDYQIDVLQRAVKAGRGTCILGTGAGKTFITAALVENIYRLQKRPELFKCVIVVPDLGLVEQTYNEFISFGTTFKLTKWTGSHKPDLTSNVFICNIGILQSEFEQNNWVKYIDLLIVDECHKIKPDNKISKLISKIKTNNRYGFTGTLPEEQLDKWSVIGKFGPVIYEKTSFDLRREDFLVNAEVKILEIEYKQTPQRLTDNAYRNELHFIYTNSFRNNLIRGLCSKLNNNTLVLVNHIEHGEILLQELSTIDTKKVFFIRGEVEVEEREKIKKLMEETNDVICIAISAIFSTGVNIKNLHNIIFAAGGKSFIRTVQSIGRGLRKHTAKEKLIIIDLADKLTYGTAHNEKRQQIYTKEKINFSKKIILQP